MCAAYIRDNDVSFDGVALNPPLVSINGLDAMSFAIDLRGTW
jgi:hypothetical protein